MKLNQLKTAFAVLSCSAKKSKTEGVAFIKKERKRKHPPEVKLNRLDFISKGGTSAAMV